MLHEPQLKAVSFYKGRLIETYKELYSLASHNCERSESYRQSVNNKSTSDVGDWDIAERSL